MRCALRLCVSPPQKRPRCFEDCASFERPQTIFDTNRVGQFLRQIRKACRLGHFTSGGDALHAADLRVVKHAAQLLIAAGTDGRERKRRRSRFFPQFSSGRFLYRLSRFLVTAGHLPGRTLPVAAEHPFVPPAGRNHRDLQPVLRDFIWLIKHEIRHSSPSPEGPARFGPFFLTGTAPRFSFRRTAHFGASLRTVLFLKIRPAFRRLQTRSLAAAPLCCPVLRRDKNSRLPPVWKSRFCRAVRTLRGNPEAPGESRRTLPAARVFC